MKILGIIGSPRLKGNTQKMVSYLLDGAKKAGYETDSISLNELNYRGCQDCGGCSESFKCVLTDDLHEVYEGIDQADEIIIASPIYMWQCSGQIKLMLDRFLPYFIQNRKTKGFDKKVVFVFSQENEDAMFNVDYIRLMEQSIERIGFTFKDTFIAGANKEINDIDKKIELTFRLKSYYSSTGILM